MRALGSKLGALVSLAVIAAQTGCASSVNPAPSVYGPPSADAHVGPLVYVSDAANSLIAVFDRNGTLVGTITKGLKYPLGLFVDRDGNLWIANAGYSNVLEFARGGTSPIAMLPDGDYYTGDVTICPDGTIYAATLLSGITKYSGKKHHMSGTLEYYGTEFQFVTCDAAGNVFATGVYGTTGNVIVFPGGQDSGAHLLPISSPGNLGGIKPDNAGNILVDDPAGTVTEYTESGSPTGKQIDTKDRWLDIALSRDGRILFGSDETVNDGVAVTFPSDRQRATYRDSFSAAWGIAVDPGQKGI